MKQLIFKAVFLVAFMTPALAISSQIHNLNRFPTSCTVTAVVKLGVATVTISSTKDTCEEAAADVKEGIRKLLAKK